MAPVRSSGGKKKRKKKGEGSPKSFTSVAQYDTESGVLFTYDGTTDAIGQAAEGKTRSDQTSGHILPGLSTDILDEMEQVTRGEASREVAAAASPFGAESAAHAEFFTLGDGPVGSGGVAGDGLQQLENILGLDDRARVQTTDQSPFRWICLLRMISPNGTPLIGTGWMAGKRTLVTAGHCVYNHDRRYGIGPMQKITVFAGRNRDDWEADSVATTANAPPQWVNGASAAHDYAAVGLSNPLGEQLNWFEYAEFSDQDLSALRVSVVGYPADKNRGLFGTMWGSANKITVVASQRLGYLVDTMGGQSGSPVIHFDGDSRYYVVGIHNYGGNSANFATRINSSVFDQLAAWIK